MYERVGEIDADTLIALQALADTVEWKLVLGSGRDYATAYVQVAQYFDWTDWHSAFFLKIPPGGKVHKHIDVEHPWNTYHVVIQTNPESVSYMAGQPYRLETGQIYLVDRQVEHWSENNGDTDRIHLLAEVYE